ncbi:MAG: aromatic amino acid ammonia-lyase, partial [Bacteroidales bacterium]|nr:aromatic amino acid ammonia-lyase [Bacteroidales bacterium]
MIYYNQELSLQEIESLLFTNEKIALSPKAEKRVESSYQFLKEFSQGKVIYGINTGFGPMAQYRVSDETLSELQYNIIRSHATGAGEPLSDLQVKAAMIARLGTLVQGYSGIHLSVLQLLVEFINRGIYPLIPRHGSVGASGDLVQLAHLGLTLIGEGKVHYKGEWRDTAGVLKEN